MTPERWQELKQLVGSALAVPEAERKRSFEDAVPSCAFHLEGWNDETLARHGSNLLGLGQGAPKLCRRALNLAQLRMTGRIVEPSRPNAKLCGKRSLRHETSGVFTPSWLRPTGPSQPGRP